MIKKPSILLVEDSPSLAEVYKQYLSREDVSIIRASTGKDAIKAIDVYSPQLILLDLKLPDVPGEHVLSYSKKHNNQCAVIIITGHGSINIAVDLMRSGAHDFLQKPIDATRLRAAVRNCIENLKLKSLVADLNDGAERNQYHGFIGSSLPMQSVYNTIEAASRSDVTIFITGESGTGKEVCAEAIHNQSTRSDEPFIALNCGAIPKDLMESEIFGHIKGAFTGASNDRKGAASLANNGTLFLDEIGEMDLELQTKLLRFIQSSTIKKIGGNKEEKVNVRFICATNKEPLVQVANGSFREDLYYRINVVPIHLPPLRDRDQDIIKLASHFLKIYSHEDGKNFSDISDNVKQKLLSYDWPGNVRQLQNIIRNVVVLHNTEKVELFQLPYPLNDTVKKTGRLKENKAQTSPSPTAETENDTKDKPEIQDKIRPLSMVEREIIEHAINQCNGNIPKAAALLDVSPSTIYRKKQNWQ